MQMTRLCSRMWYPCIFQVHRTQLFCLHLDRFLVRLRFGHDALFKFVFQKTHRRNHHRPQRRKISFSYTVVAIWRREELSISTILLLYGVCFSYSLFAFSWSRHFREWTQFTTSTSGHRSAKRSRSTSASSVNPWQQGSLVTKRWYSGEWLLSTLLSIHTHHASNQQSQFGLQGEDRTSVHHMSPTEQPRGEYTEQGVKRLQRYDSIKFSSSAWFRKTHADLNTVPMVRCFT